MPEKTIGRLAGAAGCRAETVHYYERTRQMPASARSPGGHRLHAAAACQRLAFIRRCCEPGVGNLQVRTLLGFADEPDHSFSEVRAGAHAAARS